MSLIVPQTGPGHEPLTIQQMHGIGSLTDREREEITCLIIEAIVSKYMADQDKEVCDGGVDAIEFHLMKYPALQKYPEYIVHHVLDVNVNRARILDSVLDRPVLMSAREKATVII